jgi:hypothetical protein
MNLTLGRRLAALEAVNRAANNSVLIVIRIITPPSLESGEATFATALGQRFTREPPETEDDFIQRIHDYAKANCPAGQSGVQVLIDDHDFERERLAAPS